MSEPEVERRFEMNCNECGIETEKLWICTTCGQKTCTDCECSCKVGEETQTRKRPEIVEVPEPAYRSPEPDVIVMERGEMRKLQVDTLAKLYLEENPDDYLNLQVIRRFARWMVSRG